MWSCFFCMFTVLSVNLKLKKRVVSSYSGISEVTLQPAFETVQERFRDYDDDDDEGILF